ncbi:MAG: GNAT family N-acetyltransferase [Lachnospiraceae bacterium]|nr:GNAT family N-acetyltransferase [Lachnospiraceae bacterium]
MRDLKNCFFCISDNDTPWLDELMTELNDAGVRLFTLEPGKKIPEIAIPEGSYTVTDNEDGAAFAEHYDTGYVLYRKPGIPCSVLGSSASSVLSEAQCIIEGFDEITPDFLEKMYQRKNGIPWTIVETPRTIIRELSLDDIDDLFSLYEDPEIQRFIPPLLPTKEEETEFQKAYIEKMYGFFGYGFWNITDREKGTLIGRAGISNREGFDIPELGYLLDRAHREKGIAEEVCRAIIKYAHEILGIDELNLFLQKQNLPSIRLAGKLGFTDTGEMISGHNDSGLMRYHLNLT